MTHLEQTLLKIIEQNHGISFTKLFTEISLLIKTKSFYVQMTLNRLLSENKIALKDQLYFIKSLPSLFKEDVKVSVPEKEPIIYFQSVDIPEDIKTSTRPYGTLSKDTMIGRVAYIIYHYRHKGVNRNQIRDITETSNSNLTTILNKLEKHQFIVSVENSGKKHYTWGTYFKYPFQCFRSHDVVLIDKKIVTEQTS